MDEKELILSSAPDWACQLAEMALACSGAFACEEARQLAACHALLTGAVRSGLLAGFAMPDSERFAELLRAGAGESAAIALLGDSCGYMLSRGAMGEALATVVLPGGAHECSANGDTLGLAIAAALAQGLSESCCDRAPALHPAERRALRFN